MQPRLPRKQQAIRTEQIGERVRGQMSLNETQLPIRQAAGPKNHAARTLRAGVTIAEILVPGDTEQPESFEENSRLSTTYMNAARPQKVNNNLPPRSEFGQLVPWHDSSGHGLAPAR